MRVLLIPAISLAITLAAGCDSAKSPEAVANDTAAAQQKASTELEKSEQAAAKDVDKAADKVDDKMTDLNNAAAKDAYKVAVAQADGDRKVTLAKCTALNGDAQKACKDQADANYNAAKANAKSVEAAEKQ